MKYIILSIVILISAASIFSGCNKEENVVGQRIDVRQEVDGYPDVIIQYKAVSFNVCERTTYYVRRHEVTHQIIIVERFVVETIDCSTIQWTITIFDGLFDLNDFAKVELEKLDEKDSEGRNDIIRCFDNYEVTLASGASFTPSFSNTVDWGDGPYTIDYNYIKTVIWSSLW